MKDLELKRINSLDYQERIIDLLLQLNDKQDREKVKMLLTEMAQLPSYMCFALFKNNMLIGVCSGWTTVRIYCGKQLELDNVIIDSTTQSKGYGKYFMEAVKKWSLENNYQSLSLNTYVENSRSHKFYFNQGFEILGFHFENRLNSNII